MNLTWGAVLMFHTLLTWPVSGVFLIYAFGAMILLGQWQLFLIAVGVFLFAIVLEAVLGILTE